MTYEERREIYAGMSFCQRERFGIQAIQDDVFVEDAYRHVIEKTSALTLTPDATVDERFRLTRS
jgi:hypothetical protein